MDPIAWVEQACVAIWLHESARALFAPLIVHTLIMAAIAALVLASSARGVGIASGAPIKAFGHLTPIKGWMLLAAAVSGTVVRNVQVVARIVIEISEQQLPGEDDAGDIASEQGLGAVAKPSQNVADEQADRGALSSVTLIVVMTTSSFPSPVKSTMASSLERLSCRTV